MDEAMHCNYTKIQPCVDMCTKLKQFAAGTSNLSWFSNAGKDDESQTWQLSKIHCFTKQGF